jgi:CRP-like cAMP-binding protein
MADSPTPLRMSRREIADCLGLRVETVSRAIGQLRKLRLIDRIGLDAIVVLDNPGLCRIGKVRSIEPFGAHP